MAEENVVVEAVQTKETKPMTARKDGHLGLGMQATGLPRRKCDGSNPTQPT